MLQLFFLANCINIGLSIFNPLPDDKILDCSNSKQIADDILKCIYNEKKVPYRLENIVFHRYISLERQNEALRGNGLTLFPKHALVFTSLQYKSFKDTVGKGEIAHNQQFLLFQECFLPCYRTFCRFHQI